MTNKKPKCNECFYGIYHCLKCDEWYCQEHIIDHINTTKHNVITKMVA